MKGKGKMERNECERRKKNVRKEVRKEEGRKWQFSKD